MTIGISAHLDYVQRKRQLAKLDNGVTPLFIATLEGVKTPEQILLEKEQSQRIEQLINRLSPRTGLAVRLRYGIGCEPLTLEQIAERFGVSSARIRQIIAKGERLIRRWVLLKERPKQLRELEQLDAEQQIAKNRASDERRRREVEANRTAHDIEQAAREAANRERFNEQRQLRNEAFAVQAKDLNDARNEYFAHLGAPDEFKFYLAYIYQMNDWGPRHDRIWRLFPHG